MTPPDRITTERLRLILITPADATVMRAGRRVDRWHPCYPRPDDLDAAAMVRDPADPWGPRHVVLGHRAVGSIGCFGPPVQGEAEVGFGLVPDARGDGIATEALRGLAVEADRARVRLRAAVEPDNAAGVRVLAKCGFTELRGGTDDGRLVMARPLPAGG